MEAECLPVLEAVDLQKYYEFQRPFSRVNRRIAALRGVSLTIEAGAMLGLTGESGCGKSTLARCLSGLESPSSGRILTWSQSLSAPTPDRHALLQTVQLVVQDASSAINPRFSAAEVLTEPLVIRRGGSTADYDGQARELMQAVGLPGAWVAKRSFEFSGGQLQRLAIARALAANPRVLILDEALASLDISTAMQILALLRRHRVQDGLACLIVSHDLSLLSAVVDHILVMQAGLVVERAPARVLLAQPVHAQTRALVAAISPMTSFDERQ